MTNKITTEDIRKALDIVNCNKPPLTRSNFDWGWIETDEIGNPINIGVTKETREKINDFFEETIRFKTMKDGTKIKTFEGIPIVKSNFEIV